MVNRELYEKIIDAQTNSSQNVDEIRRKLEKLLAGKYTKMLCIKGETICGEGQLDDNMYFIERGKVIITRKDMYDREYTGVYFMPGEFFGMSSFTTLPQEANFKALTNCNVYMIKTSIVKEMVAQNEDARELLISILINTIRMMTIRQSNMTMGGCRHAFINFILEHVKDFGRIDDQGDIVVSLDVNLIDIAEILNMTRETLSRIVSEMKRENIIDTKRRYIKILDLGRFIA